MNAFMNIMQQMGINFNNSGNGEAVNSAPPSVSLADVGPILYPEDSPFQSSGDSLSGNSKNAAKLRKILNEATGIIENPVVICFKIEKDKPIYADFTHGKGIVTYWRNAVYCINPLPKYLNHKFLIIKDKYMKTMWERLALL